MENSLPEAAFSNSKLNNGDLFQFVPTTCAELLTMDWLYSDRVRGNFERVFKTKLQRQP